MDENLQGKPKGSKKRVAVEKEETFTDIDANWVEPEAFGKNLFKSKDYLHQKIAMNIHSANPHSQPQATQEN